MIIFSLRGQLKVLDVTDAELESFQNTFMELDMDCGGELRLDELKLLVVMMGEEMDKEELQLLLDEFDTDKSGSLNFQEFSVMMKNWNTRFGKGLAKVYNEATKRGAIGKARRHFNGWWNQKALDKAAIAEAKAKKIKEKADLQDLAVKFQSNERIAREREEEMKRRALSRI